MAHFRMGDSYHGDQPELEYINDDGVTFVVGSLDEGYISSICNILNGKEPVPGNEDGLY